MTNASNRTALDLALDVLWALPLTVAGNYVVNNIRSILDDWAVLGWMDLPIMVSLCFWSATLYGLLRLSKSSPMAKWLAMVIVLTIEFARVYMRAHDLMY
jgi:hypothetical protein